MSIKFEIPLDPDYFKFDFQIGDRTVTLHIDELNELHRQAVQKSPNDGEAIVHNMGLTLKEIFQLPFPLPNAVVMQIIETKNNRVSELKKSTEVDTEQSTTTNSDTNPDPEKSTSS
jgi:hypothetical protein